MPLLERAKLLLSYFLDCGSAKLVLLSICFSRVVYMVLLILPIGLCQLVFWFPCLTSMQVICVFGYYSFAPRVPVVEQ